MHALVPAVLLRMAGLNPFDRIPRRSHQTGELAEPIERVGDANGTPLSVRIAAGSPNSRNVRSKAVKAKRSCVVDSASHVSR